MTKQELNYQIQEAAAKGHLDMVKSSIRQGADIESKGDYDDGTALIFSSKYGYLDIVKYLIEKGADIDAKSYVGYTALMQSSSSGHLKIVKYLIEKGSDIDAKNDDDYTALILSSRERHLEVVKYLINKGADIEAETNYGYTALYYIVRKNMLNDLISTVYNYNFFEIIYNKLTIEQKHLLFKHFMNNRELLEQVNPRIMKGFIPDINEYKDNLKQGI